jgi:hypothetical protein
MTYTDTGTIGAKVQSWHAANPRDLLKRVIDDHPGADRAALFHLFLEKLKEEDDSDYVDTIIEYWFVNNYHSLIGFTAKRQQAAKAQREEWVAGTEAKLSQKIAEAANVVLSEMIMPNGKQLAACTGQECVDLQRRMGSWLGKVVRRVKPDQAVGDVLTEEDLQTLYAKRA